MHEGLCVLDVMTIDNMCVTISNNSFPKIGTEITIRFWPHFFIQRNRIGHRSANGINTREQSSPYGRPFRKSPNGNTFAQNSTWQHFHATTSRPTPKGHITQGPAYPMRARTSASTAHVFEYMIVHSMGVHWARSTTLQDVRETLRMIRHR